MFRPDEVRKALFQLSNLADRFMVEETKPQEIQALTDVEKRNIEEAKEYFDLFFKWYIRKHKERT